MIKKKNNFSLYLIIGILCFPFIVNIVMVLFEQLPNNYKFILANDLGNKEWLSFGGSYLSGIATFVSVYVMYRMNEKIMLNQRKEAIYNHEKEKLNELKKILIQALEGFEVTQFLTFNMSDLEENRKKFQIYQEKLLKNIINVELLSDIYAPDNSIDNIELRLIIGTLRDSYNDINILCSSMISKYLTALSEGEEAFIKIIDETKTDKSLLSKHYLDLRVNSKLYLSYKEKLMDEKFRK
ncbi:MAG: hypothetical protein ACRCZO_08295 [Cetobacterium sp.]